MKKKSLRTHPVIIPVLLISLLSLVTSCSKDEDNKVNLAAITILHASPGLPIDVYLGSNRINADSAFSYGDTIPYKFINAGSLTITVKKHISSITYIGKAFQFDPESYYSFFITGKPDSVTYVMAKDNMSKPSAGKAKLRFINLSPDAPALDLKTASGTALFSALHFKSISDFVEVDPGQLNLNIYRQGTDSALTTHTIQVEPSRLYTVWANGLLNTSDPAIAFSAADIGIEHK